MLARCNFTLIYTQHYIDPENVRTIHVASIRPSTSGLEIKSSIFLKWVILIGPSTNHPQHTYGVLLYSGNVTSRNVTWTRIPPFEYASIEIVHSVSLGGKDITWIKFAIEWAMRMRMCMSQACMSALDRTSLQAFCTRLLRLLHVGGLDHNRTTLKLPYIPP